MSFGESTAVSMQHRHFTPFGVGGSWNTSGSQYALIIVWSA
jgi:hypothetical protein